MQKTYMTFYLILTMSFLTVLSAHGGRKRKIGEEILVEGQQCLIKYFTLERKKSKVKPSLEIVIDETEEELLDGIFEVDSDVPEKLSDLQNEMINLLDEDLQPEFLAVLKERFLLQENGTYIFEVNLIKDKSTLLLWAAHYNAWLLAEKLIKDGADGNLSVGDSTPLSVAAKLGSFEFCKLLIAKGACVNENSRYKNALHQAAKRSDRELCELLANKMQDVDCQMNNGYTALLYAAREGNADLCHYLLGRGASVSKVTSTGGTVLMLACKSQNIRTITALLDAGANVYTKNSNNETALHVAAKLQNSRITYLILLYTYKLRLNDIYNLLSCLRAHYHYYLVRLKELPKSTTLSLDDEYSYKKNKSMTQAAKFVYKERKDLVVPAIRLVLANESLKLKSLLEVEDTRGKRAYDYFKTRALNPDKVEKLETELLHVTGQPLESVEELPRSQKTQQRIIVKDGDLLLG